MTAAAAIAELWAVLVSPDGRVPGEDCWPWPGARNAKGYGATKRNGENVASRAIWVELFGPIPPELKVLHHCDNPPCVRPAHLYLGTASRNTADMLARGRGVAPVNDGNGKTKLTIDQVVELRARAGLGERLVDLAPEFGVHAAHASRICSRKRRQAVTR